MDRHPEIKISPQYLEKIPANVSRLFEQPNEGGEEGAAGRANPEKARRRKDAVPASVTCRPSRYVPSNSGPKADATGARRNWTMPEGLTTGTGKQRSWVGLLTFSVKQGGGWLPCAVAPIFAQARNKFGEGSSRRPTALNPPAISACPTNSRQRPKTSGRTQSGSIVEATAPVLADRAFRKARQP